MVEGDVPLASLSLTHVHYNPDDPLSFLSAFLSLVPQALCIVYVTLVWASREVEIAFMFAGQLACEGLNFILKRLIRQERPSLINGNGYGMPSSHSQFVAFFSVFVILFLFFRHNPGFSTALPSDSPTTYIQRVGVSVLACIGATAVSLSRIYLDYHTPGQVLAGVTVGVFFALFWFHFGTLLRRNGWIEWFLETEISRFCRVRDLLITEDFAESGWQRWKTMKRLAREEQVNEVKKSD